MRTRIRALIAVAGVAVAVLFVAAPAFAADDRPRRSSRTRRPSSASRSSTERRHRSTTARRRRRRCCPAKNEVIWGSLAFLVLLIAMWKFGVPAVRNMEQAREDRIRNDLEGAEKATTEAEAEKAQYLAQIADARDEAGRIIEEARQSAEQVRRT